jgi:hypothetical protein
MTHMSVINNISTWICWFNRIQIHVLQYYETDKSVALLEEAISEPLDEKKAIEVATKILAQACRLDSSPKGEGEGDVDPDSMIDLYIISSNGDDKQSLVRRTISI